MKAPDVLPGDILNLVPQTYPLWLVEVSMSELDPGLPWGEIELTMHVDALCWRVIAWSILLTPERVTSAYPVVEGVRALRYPPDGIDSWTGGDRAKLVDDVVRSVLPRISRSR